MTAHFDKFLYALATIKLALLGAFFLFAANVTHVDIAQAEEISCTGIDLVERMAREEPDRLAKIRQEASKTIHGNARLWKITRGNLPASWLFGTMHMAEARVTNLPDKVKTALDQSKLVAVENTDAMDKQIMQQAIVKYKDMTLLTDGSTVDQLLDEASVKRLKKLTADQGLPFGIAQRMQPWMLAAFASAPACELQMKNVGKLSLDMKIATYAKENDKTLIGLESIEEQFSAISSLPRSFHATALSEVLERHHLIDDIMHSMKTLYLDDQIAMLMPFARSFSPKAAALEEGANFQEKMITLRNETMLKRGLEHLEKGGAFIAVGALHLPGEHGLVQLVKEAGYSVEQVK